MFVFYLLLFCLISLEFETHVKQIVQQIGYNALAIIKGNSKIKLNFFCAWSRKRRIYAILSNFGPTFEHKHFVRQFWVRTNFILWGPSEEAVYCQSLVKQSDPLFQVLCCPGNIAILRTKWIWHKFSFHKTLISGGGQTHMPNGQIYIYV